MKLLILSIIAVFILGIFAINQFAYASIEKRDNCIPNMACFVQGDYLKYYETLNGKPFFYLNYTHEAIVDETTILVGDWEYSVSEFPISTYDGSKFVNPIQLFFKANLNTGISNNEILVLHTIPIDTDHWLENKWNVTNDSFTYKSLPRPVVITTHYDTKYVIDKQTGITLYYQSDDPNSSRQVKIYSLIDSDIITSENTPYDSSKSDTIITNEQKLQIPSWIKKNAKWWSEGKIGDTDFVLGIKHLIEQNIIKIPPTKSGSSNSQQIPSWIKNNAMWWAEGQISDDDFVKGVQYMISDGIMKISTIQNSSLCQGTKLCITGTVEKIVDGDTIYVKGEKIRLSLTNTPEKNESGYSEATQFTSTLCPLGSPVTVDQDDKQPYDKFDRMVAKVFCGSKMLNEELLINNHAKILTDYCSTSEYASELWAKKFGC